jgi:hypothetical protein
VTFSAFTQDIFQASREGNLRQIKKLVRMSSDTVHAVNAQGFNPLMIACYRGQEKTAKLLVKSGADVNAKSPEGSALQAACYQDNTKLTRFLIKEKADLNVAGPDGNTALMYAVLNQNVKLVRALVKAGADLKARNNDGQTAYTLAMTLPDEAIREQVRAGNP